MRQWAMREIHVGRLIDHVHLRASLRASDLAAAKRFYRAVLGALGKPIGADDESHLRCDELWIDALGERSSVRFARAPGISSSRPGDGAALSRSGPRRRRP